MTQRWNGQKMLTDKAASHHSPDGDSGGGASTWFGKKGKQKNQKSR